MIPRAALRLAVDVADVAAPALLLAGCTGGAMSIVAVAGTGAAALGGPAVGGLVVGALSVCVVLGLVQVALNIRPIAPVRPLMPQTHPRGIRRAALGVLAATLLLAVLLSVTGCVPVDQPARVVTTTAVDTSAVVIR